MIIATLLRNSFFGDCSLFEKLLRTNQSSCHCEISIKKNKKERKKNENAPTSDARDDIQKVAA